MSDSHILILWLMAVMLMIAINGLALRWSTLWIDRFKPSYLRACLAVIPGMLMIWVIAALVALLILLGNVVLEHMDEDIALPIYRFFTEGPLGTILMLPIGVAAFLSFAISIKRYLKRPDGTLMKLWPDACLVTFLVFLIGGILQAAVFVLAPIGLSWFYARI